MRVAAGRLCLLALLLLAAAVHPPTPAAAAATSLRLASAAVGVSDASCFDQPDHAPCDDGDKCTVGDYCMRGVCVAGTAKVGCKKCLACMRVRACLLGGE